MSSVIEDAHLAEHGLHSEAVFDGRLLKVFRDQVALPDGSIGVREYIKHPGAVVIIAHLDNGKLLFERQFRYPVGQVCLELPAGKIDPEEAIEQTATRELLEETGYTARHWRHLGYFLPCIGYSNERIEVFEAHGLVQVAAQQLDAGEFLDVVELSLPEVRASIARGVLTDSKTLSALQIWQCQQENP